MHPCLFIDAPLMPYAQGLGLMRGLAAARRSGRVDDALILTAHPPVITLGRRGGTGDLLFPEAELAARGVAVERVERGGLVTAHGPGQLMVYPVMHLPSLGLGVAEFVHRLEEAALGVCAAVGVEAGRRQDHPGLWVGERKIASLGLAVSRGVTTHGLALYNRPEPELFSLINPCGLAPGAITSLAELRGRPVEDTRLRRLMAQGLARTLELEMKPWPLARALEESGYHDQAATQATLAQA